MAILSKIRKLPIFLIILIIGIPLLTFVVDPTALTDFFNSSKVNSVATVGGEPITRNELSAALEEYKQRNKGQAPSMQVSKSILNNLVRSKVYSEQLSKAGITIGESDIMNVLYNDQGFQQNPSYQTEGIFDKSKLKNYLADIKEKNTSEWQYYQVQLAKRKTILETNNYNSLVSAGLGASLKEGELKYTLENTKINGDLVFVPFATIKDSTVVISDSDVKQYINTHQDEFKVEASRDIEYVRFDIKPTTQDEANITTEFGKVINDHEEHSNAAKGVVTVKGLKSATDYGAFFIDNKSDLPFNENITFKNQLPATISTQILAGEKGQVFGPYKDKEYFKASKIIDIVNLPDSVKARHILIPYVGCMRAKPGTTKTEVQAKKTADSLFSILKVNSSNFNEYAKNISSGPSASKGGDLGWFPYNQMAPEFRDFCFLNKVGNIGVVKTVFGFHIIKIENQKNFQNALKLATFGRLIEASEETGDKVFENASLFEQEITNGKTFTDVAKEKTLKITPAVGITALAENIPGIGKQRSIVNWVFEKDIKVGSYKRFDIENGYIIARIIDKTEKGLMPSKKAMAKVRPIIMNEKKAKLIEAQMKGATLEEIAKSTEQTVRKVDGVTLKTPTISGVGYEPNVVGAMINAKANAVHIGIVGNKGVFAVKTTNRVTPTTLPNYDTERKRISNQRKNKSYQIYEALKKASNVEDNLSSFYGIQ